MGNGLRHLVLANSKVWRQADGLIPVRGNAWQEVKKTGPMGGEIEAFRGPVEHRLRADGVRAMLRTEGRAENRA